MPEAYDFHDALIQIEMLFQSHILSFGYKEYSLETFADRKYFAGWKGSYGYLVIISHGGLFETYYAHCSKILVSVGENVYQGQNIALVGSTGYSTGPHCHFEVRYNGTPNNPLNYL